MSNCLHRLARFALVPLALSILAGTLVHAEPRRPWTTSRVKGAPTPPAPYRIQPAFPGVRFTLPTSIEQFPAEERLLITEMDGGIYSFAKLPNVAKMHLVGDLSELTGDKVSLFDAEFHPRFTENRYVFVCYVHNTDGTRLSRFTLTRGATPKLVADSERVVITWPSGGHNGGCLEFGTDGYLYVATGDGSGPNPPDGLTTGQDVSDLLGAILRLDVDRKAGEQNYVVPRDNPFVDVKDARPEIWAYGLRNPWKIGVDPQTGEVFAADNGWETWEMVHQIVRGGNCGWPIMEGRAILRSEVEPGPTPIRPPVKDHSHTEANSVIGGPVYRGSKLSELDGAFIYGDYITGTIWSVQRDGDAYSSSTLVDTDLRITAFTQGSNDELYVLDYDFTGQIYELLPSDAKDTSADFPRRLSETGLFASVDTLEPAPGVVPYRVVVDRWMDGATARRWVAIPGDGTIALASDEAPAKYPEGTVLVKHLELPIGGGNGSVRLETQILQRERGQWHPYSYLWNDDGTDAELVSSIGANRSLKIPDTAAADGYRQRTWHVSAQNECKLCHNPGSQSVLGFSPHQLNVEEGARRQLPRLAREHVIAEAPAIAADDPGKLVAPDDSSASLNDRARSYLHANCSMCHHPGGNAIVSFYLRRELPFGKLNTNKGTGIGTFGMKNAKLIVPGDPYRSVVMYRMSKLGYGRMPYIGSQVVDSAGVALIEEWIRSLSDDLPDDASPPIQPDSAEAQALATLADDDVRPADRQRAAGQLAKTTSGSLALIARMHRGSLNDADFASAVNLGGTAGSDIRGLFETFIPESERRPTLGPNIDPQVILAKKGDAGRGKLIFFSDSARCRNCHDVTDPAKSLGTTLAEINKKYPRDSELLQHVLQPSLKIDEKFAAHAVLTVDGQVVTGLLAENRDSHVVVQTADRKRIRIARDDIDEIQKSPKSLMPDRILSDLTATEAADLLAYIRSVKGAAGE